MSEQQEGSSDIVLFPYRSKDAPLSSLSVLTPQTSIARDILTDKKIYWGPKPCLERHLGLVQSHLALVEKAALGQLDNEARNCYLDVLKWQLKDAQEIAGSPRSGGRLYFNSLDSSGEFHKSIVNVGTLDCLTKDDRESLLKESRYWVEQVAKAGIFRAAYGTLDEIEKRIAEEFGPGFLFGKVGKVVIAEE